MKVGLAGSLRSTITSLRGKRLVALLDPDFPVHIVFAKGIMVGLDAIDGRGADIIGGPAAP